MPTPDAQSEFDAFLTALMEYHRSAAFLAGAAQSDKYIQAQVYVYVSQSEAAGYYAQAHNIQAAKNAVVAGIVALCTMYVAAAVMGKLAVSVAGEVSAAEAAAAPALVTVPASVPVIGSYNFITTTGLTLPALSFTETIAVEALFGAGIRAVIAGMGAVISDMYAGMANWSDWGKVIAGASGGVTRTGPALAFLYGVAAAQENKKARAALEAEIAKPGIRKTMERIDKAFAAEITKVIEGCGQYARLLYVPRQKLDLKIRQPMVAEVDRITDAVVKAQTGLFGGPKRGDVFASVYSKMGAEVLTPIAQHTTRARIKMSMMVRDREKAMNAAYLAWVKSLK